MDEKSPRRASYVERAAEDTQRLLRELIAENERLNRQLLEVSDELERQRREQDQLRRQLSEFEHQSRSYADQFAEIEQRNLNLANLYVSSYQLHGTLDRSAVLDAIKEIMINLIGSEELAVFELGADRDTLELVTSFGIDQDRYQRVSLANDAIGKLAGTGEIYVGQPSVQDDRPQITACLPLKLDGVVMGAIVLFSLLPHKPGLQELDFELFDLLGTHAATALYCTSLHSRLAGAGA